MHRLRGERTGKVYGLGQKLRVKVVRVNLDERKIDLEPLEELPGGRAPARPAVQPRGGERGRGGGADRGRKGRGGGGQGKRGKRGR
jgi:ribonuclease R